jgi:hypothetical protein
MRPTVRTEISDRQQAPDPKLPGIGMRFLPVIDLHHERQPHLAGVLRTTLFVHEPGKLLGLEPLDPGIDGGWRDVHKATDAPPIPAVIIQFNDLQPRLVTIGMV